MHLGCGLRRHELTDLTLEHLQRREDHWAIVDLVGKARHVRTIPVSDWAKRTIDDWLTAASVVDGRFFRRVCRTGTIWGEEMTEKVVWHVVKEYAGILGVSKSHHTIFGARVLVYHSAGGELEQIQFLLDMFQCRPLKYLGCKQRFREAVNDEIGIEPSA